MLSTLGAGLNKKEETFPCTNTEGALTHVTQLKAVSWPSEFTFFFPSSKTNKFSKENLNKTSADQSCLGDSV